MSTGMQIGDPRLYHFGPPCQIVSYTSYIASRSVLYALDSAKKCLLLARRAFRGSAAAGLEPSGAPGGEPSRRPARERVLAGPPPATGHLTAPGGRLLDHVRRARVPRKDTFRDYIVSMMCTVSWCTI